GQVAGGSKPDCKKSIIKAPPGDAQNQGTVCVVEVRSVDGCLERTITLDNEEGNYEFLELPPLEALTVAVVEHSDPVIKDAFQVQGGSTVDLSKKDTLIDFTYFAPPEVQITGGMDPAPGCSADVFVLDQGEYVTLSIKLVERYVETPADDGVCPLDTAGFRIINGFADQTLDTAMSNGLLTYKFQVGLPNPSPPFLKTLQIIGKSLADREGTLTRQAIVTGIRNKENTFTSMMPEIPTIILRDPPGDGSSAFLEKNEKICKTTVIKSETEVGLNNTLEISSGPKITAVLAPLGIGIIEEIEPKIMIGTEAQLTYQRISDNSFETCTSFSNKISTDDGELIVGGERGGDVFVGEAINLIFGFADKVSFDTCTVTVKQVLNVQPGNFATTFVYSEFNIRNNMMRYLGNLAANPDADSADVARYLESIDRWN
ncbi:MAG TPA: hypothetical protein PKL15_20160, partial [Saprospiraceae bacterium]|nr:hypothetical protein [Saprospiraceae bacterium]